MKILHISTRLILGGSQENTVLSCEGQARAGHEVHLAFGPILGPEGSMLERVHAFRATDPFGRERRIECHEVPDLVRELHPLRDARCYAQLRGLIRELRPDIVHTHSSKAGILGRAAAWAEGGARGTIGVVHTIHGPPFHLYETPWKNRLYIRAEQWAARRCHLIIGVARAMRDQFILQGIGREEQYAVVPSGCETQDYLTPRPGAARPEVRAALGLADGDIVIATVARLAELKGHDDLLDALSDTLRARPSWKLLWIGDGWWRDRLAARVLQMGLQHQVVMTGLVRPERIPGLVRAADVVVHPSYREGLPRAIVQALLCGTPVVAYDVDGTSEVCEDRVTGRLVRPGDLAGLRESITWMIEQPDEARRTAAEGRARCAASHSAEHMVAELERLYTRIRPDRGS